MHASFLRKRDRKVNPFALLKAIMDAQLAIPKINQDRILLLTAAAFFGGTKALREFLLQARPDFIKPELFKQCLDSEKDNEFLKNLYSNQKQLLFPETGYPDVHTLDITLLGKVIRACTTCGAKELRDTVLKYDPKLNDPDYCKKRVKALNLFTNKEKDLLCSALAKLDETKEGLAVVRKLLKFLKTEKQKIQVCKKILEHNPKLANPDDFNRLSINSKGLNRSEKDHLRVALSTGDVSKVELGQLQKLLTTLEKENQVTQGQANINQGEADESFEDFALSLRKNLPKKDYECLHLMELCRNTMAHWGDKELPEDKYRAYFAALEEILKDLKFDVAAELQPFKSGVASKEGAILEGRVLFMVAKLQDEIHLLEETIMETEEDIRNLKVKQSSDNAKQNEEIEILQGHVEGLIGKYDYFSVQHKDLVTRMADVTEFNTKSVEKLEKDIASLIKLLGGIMKEMDDAKRNMRKAFDEIRVLKDKVIKLESEKTANERQLFHATKTGKVSEADFFRKTKAMREFGLKWVEGLEPATCSRRHKPVDLKFLVDQGLVPLDVDINIKDLEGKAEHEIFNVLRPKINSKVIDQSEILMFGTPVTFVHGVGGGGKSTLSITLYHLWCKGEIFETYDFVILLQARELNALRFSSDREFALHELLQTDPAFKEILLTLDQLMEARKKLLFILDGLDELVVLEEIFPEGDEPKAAPLAKALRDLIFSVYRNYYGFPRILFLGRHAACIKLEEALQRHGMSSRSFELVVYSAKLIENYVAKFTEGNKDTGLMSLLKSSPSLMNLVSIPLYLWLFCSVYSQSKSEICPKTETELLIYMLLCFFKWHARVGDDDLSQLEFSELLERSELVQLVSTLSKVAYENLHECELIFPINETQLLPCQAHPDGFGLLLGVETADGWRCQFKHKTMQELLAAVYIINESMENSDVLSNTFLRPCLPILCSLRGAMVENSSSPSLVKNFVKKMIQPRKESDELLKSLYEKLDFKQIHNRDFMQELLFFFKCYLEYQNVVELEPCIEALSVPEDLHEGDLELVKQFLQQFKDDGIVRKLVIYQHNIDNIEEWLELFKALSSKHVPLHRRLHRLAFSRCKIACTQILKSFLKLGIHFECCFISNLKWGMLQLITEGLWSSCSHSPQQGTCPCPRCSGSQNTRFSQSPCICEWNYSKMPKFNADSLRKLLTTELGKPLQRRELYVLVPSDLHLQVFPSPGVGDKQILWKLSPTLTKKDADPGCDVVSEWEVTVNCSPPPLNSVLLCLKGAEFLALCNFLGISTSSYQPTPNDPWTRLLFTEDDLFLSAWMLLLARIWFEGISFAKSIRPNPPRPRPIDIVEHVYCSPVQIKTPKQACEAYLSSHKELLMEKEPQIGNVLFPELGSPDISLLDIRMLLTAILTCLDWKQSDKLSSDVENFLLPDFATDGDRAYLLRCWTDEIVQLGPTQILFSYFDKYFSALDAIFPREKNFESLECRGHSITFNTL